MEKFRYTRQKHSSYKRYNRKEFIRRRKPLLVIFVVLFAILLAVGASYFVKWKQSQEKVYYSEIEECTLPTLAMLYRGSEINRLFGYTREMAQQYIRDSIYILDRGYDIPLQIHMYGNIAKALEFTLYDPENRNLIQDVAVTDYEMVGGDILSAVLHIDNIIEQDHEYAIHIRLTDTNNRTIHYYSRVMYNTTSLLSDMVDLVMEHHEAMYDKSKSEFLSEFQRTNSAVNDSTNFGNISLSSTLNSMTWGTMGVSVITEPVLNILDLDSDIGFFYLTYQVGRTSDEGITEYYNVTEYYRTRVYADRRSILSYERSVNQIFVPDVSQIANKSVMIGIEENLDIQTMTSLSGKLNVFVADKAVWFMDTETKTLQKVFSFETVPTDIRQNYNQHDIKLLKITDSGDFQFIVYGYMNRGLHEGQAGIGLYTYSAELNEVREDIFIPSSLPYQVLRNSIGSLCYLNNSGMLYILLDEFVYALNSNANTAEVFISGLNMNNFKASTNGRMLAWQDGGAVNDAVRINVIDLEDGSTYSVAAAEGKNIKVLGFLDNDLVYGEGDHADLYTTADGEEYLLMSDLYVVDRHNSVQSSEHSSSGYFTTSVVEYNRVVVNRVVRAGNEFTKGDEFTLFSTDLETVPSASTYNIYDEDRRTINYLEVVNNMDPNRSGTINDTMKITLCSAEATDVGDLVSDNGKYYVYAAGEIRAILTNPAEAIMEAYYSTGLVVNNDGYFYRRTSRPTTVELTDASIAQAIQAYRNETALNITGIYLNQALYYTGRKIPVIWEWGDTPVIIYGYDLYDNLMLYDMESGYETLIAYDDIDPIFDEVGRCFICY